MQDPLSSSAVSHLLHKELVKYSKQEKENRQLPICRDDEDLPDRIVNPDMYRPLLPATNSGEGNSQNDSQPQPGVNSLVAYGSM